MLLDCSSLFYDLLFCLLNNPPLQILDADNSKRLESSTGRIATRDIVQFVPMREVQGGPISVVQSLLEELPGQFLQYMRTRGIKPQQQALPGHASAPVCPPQQ
jgi:hypothetical protein